MSKRSLGPAAQRLADKEHRRTQNDRARHNRRMKTDPDYRSAVIARRVEEGERRHAEHIAPVLAEKRRRLLEAEGRQVMALFGLRVAS